MRVLEDFLSTRSYIVGFEPSTSDNLVFEAVYKTVELRSGGDLFPNLRRWHQHIQSFGNERKKFQISASAKIAELTGSATAQGCLHFLAI